MMPSIYDFKDFRANIVPKSQYVVLGLPAQISCISYNNVEWMINEHHISDSNYQSYVKGHYNHFLNIVSVSEQHIGLYSCSSTDIDDKYVILYSKGSMMLSSKFVIMIYYEKI